MFVALEVGGCSQSCEGERRLCQGAVDSASSPKSGDVEQVVAPRLLAGPSLQDSKSDTCCC